MKGRNKVSSKNNRHGENIQVVGKTTEGTVCINYYIENNHLVEVREDLYTDLDMKDLKYCYYISTQVPAWEYFESEFNAIESKSLDEIKKLDYFKVGL